MNDPAAAMSGSSSDQLVDGVFDFEHQAFRESIRRFMAREVDPYYKQWERTEDGYPHELWLKGGAAGLLGSTIPESHGGPGGDELFPILLAEELGGTVSGASMGAFFLMDMLTLILVKFGTPEQQARYFPGILSGETSQALGLTEPDAGSDVLGLRSRARRDGDDYLISGQKLYCSNGMTAGLFYIVARTDDDVERGRSNMTMFLVEPNCKGFERRRLDTIGMKASNVAEIFLDDVRVHKSAIIGEPGQALKAVLQFLFPFDRVASALRALAVTKLAFDLTVQFTKERKVSGQRVFDFQNTQFKLAEMKANIVMAEAFRESMLRKLVAGKLDPVTASVAKLWLCDNEYQTTSDCLQLHGGYGYMTESPISRLFTFARVETIYAGTSEVQKATIAKFL